MLLVLIQKVKNAIFMKIAKKHLLTNLMILIGWKDKKRRSR